MTGATVVTHHCRACDAQLGRPVRLFCKGECPVCGARNPAGSGRNGDIVDTYERTSRRVYLRPWWKVWAGPRWVADPSSSYQMPSTKRIDLRAGLE